MRSIWQPPSSEAICRTTKKAQRTKARPKSGLVKITTVSLANGARIVMAQDNFRDDAPEPTTLLTTASTAYPSPGQLQKRQVFTNEEGDQTTIFIYAATRAGEPVPIAVESALVPSEAKTPLSVAGGKRRKVHRVIRSDAGRIEAVETFE